MGVNAASTSVSSWRSTSTWALQSSSTWASRSTSTSAISPPRVPAAARALEPELAWTTDSCTAMRVLVDGGDVHAWLPAGHFTIRGDAVTWRTPRVANRDDALSGSDHDVCLPP